MRKWFPKIYLLLIVIVIFSEACINRSKPKTYKVDLKQSMIEADLAFSKLSEEKGMKTAFMEFIDSNGVLQRPNTLPLKAGDAIDFISQANDTAVIMTWQPQGASIAESGELGYTFGVYQLQVKGTDSVSRGTYVSIWKKQSDGTWKFELNTGNEGIGE